MKRTLFLLSLACMFALSGCGVKNDPTAIATAFARDYLVRGNIDAQHKFGSGEYKQEREEALRSPEFAALFKQIIEDQGKEMRGQKLDFSLNQMNTRIEENSASIHFDVTSGVDASFNERLIVWLERDDSGRWVIDDTSYSDGGWTIEDQ